MIGISILMKKYPLKYVFFLIERTWHEDVVCRQTSLLACGTKRARRPLALTNKQQQHWTQTRVMQPHHCAIDLCDNASSIYLQRPTSLTAIKLPTHLSRQLSKYPCTTSACFNPFHNSFANALRQSLSCDQLRRIWATTPIASVVSPVPLIYLRRSSAICNNNSKKTNNRHQRHLPFQRRRP